MKIIEIKKGEKLPRAISGSIMRRGAVRFPRRERKRVLSMIQKEETSGKRTDKE